MLFLTPAVPIVTEMTAADPFGIDEPMESASVSRVKMDPSFNQSDSTPVQTPAVAVIEASATPEPIEIESVAKARSANDWLRFFLTSAIVVWALGTTAIRGSNVGCLVADGTNFETGSASRECRIATGL